MLGPKYKNKIYIGGLGSLSDFFDNHPCNVNVEEILINPSMFLWTDQLVLPKKAYNSIINGKDKQQRIITMMLNKLNDKKMLEVVDYSEKYKKEYFVELYERAEKEVALLSNSDYQRCDNDKTVPKMIDFKGCHYCAPMVASIYASIKIASENDATCILSRSEKLYLDNYVLAKKKYYDYNNIIFKILEMDLPIFDDILKYVFVNDSKCKTCVNENKCEMDCIDNFAKCFDIILTLREHDSMFKLRDILDSIIIAKDQVNTEKDMTDLKKQYFEEKEKANKMIHAILPKVKEWSSIALFIGLPLSIMSKLPPVLTNVLPGMVSAAADYVISKNNWISIVDELHNVTN